jgi:hypothetical protein
MTYYKYVKREVEDQINWAEVGKGVTDMLKAETAARFKKKEEIKEASRKFGEELSNAPTGDYDQGNTFMADFSNSQQEYRLMQDRLLQSGELSLRDYTRNRQNGMSGTSQMFDLAKEYQAEYKTKMARWEGDESSFREVWEMEQSEGLGNLRNVGAYINPTNGVISVGKRVNGQISSNPSDFATVPELRGRLKSQYDRFDLDAAAINAAGSLGAIETSVVKYASEGNLNTIVQKVDAKTGDYSQEDEDFVSNYRAWEDDQVGAMMKNPNNISSVLTDRVLNAPNGKKYTFTYDKDEFDKQGEDGNLMYIDRSDNAAGKVQFAGDQEEVVKERMRTAIRARIDETEKTKSAGTTPYEPPSNVNQGNAEDQQVSVVSNFSQLYFGDKEQKLKAADSLRAFNPNIEEINLSEDGLGVSISFNDGRASETITFGENQTDFVEAGMNFVLPDKNKIADINEVIKRGKLDLTKPVLSGTDYDFSSRGEKTVTLPFDEAYKENEGAKLKPADVLVGAGPAITKDQEKAAVANVKAQLSSLPGMSDIKVRTFNAGRGIVIQDAKGKKIGEVNLKNANTAKTELEALYQLILNKSLEQQKMLLDEDAKKKYSDDYGKRKEKKTTNTNAGGGSAPRPGG